MSFLVPAAFGVAALAGPLVVLYMLRSKRRPHEVGSTMLWKELGEAVSSAVPWKPLKLTPLLLLQLAVLGLFVLSLARPFVSEATVLGPHTVFVMDTSGSMVMAGRFEQARDAAVDFADDVSGANLASVVTAGPNPRVVVAFSGDREAVIAAIQGLSAGGGVEDISGAIRLARGLAAPDRDTSVVLFSDGGSSALAEEPVVGATQLRYGDIASNLSISGFDAEPSAEGAARAFLQVQNHGADARDIVVELTVDGLPAGSVEMTVPGLEAVGEVVPLDAGAGSTVSAVIAEANDALAMDDRSDLVVAGSSGRSVGVVGEGSPFLSTLIAATPGLGVADDTAAADLLIVDGGALPEIDRPAWIIRTETTPEGLELNGLERNLAVTFSRPGDPILDGVDLSDTAVAEAQVTDSITWLPIVSSGDTPLILIGEVNGHRVVYTTFDLTHSNLPVQVAFPILGFNLLAWLGGGGAGSVSTEFAGAPIAIVTPSGSTPQVELPDGEIRQLGASTGTFADTEQPGIYRVSYVASDGEITDGEVAVRRFAPTESAGPSREIAVAAGPGAASEESDLIREWAPWVIAAVLVLMAIEWWVGHQRPGLRRGTVVGRAA